MQLKKEIKFETLRKSHKKQIVIGVVAACIIGGALTFNLTKAKYRLTQSMKLVTGTINYKVPDMRVVALYTENDNNEYIESDDVPTSGYILNEEKSLCRVYDGTTSVAEAPIDTKATIEYMNGEIYISRLTKKNTRCYLYFDLIEDSEIPIITNVTTSATETTITVNVEATDNIGVNKYYYQIDSEEVIEKTESSHTFTGLILGSSHTIKVYVKDGRGNTSEETTKTVSTVGTSETTIAKLGITGVVDQTDTVPDFSKIATTDEGIFRTDDGMYGGNSVYWRGAATSNHVIFANKCWRIIRINGDGTIRLIYNGAPSGTALNQTCPGSGRNIESLALTNQAYSSRAISSEYVGYTYTLSVQRPTPTTGGTESNLKMQTEDWFDKNIIEDNLKKVDLEGKFCNDRTVGSGTWSVASNFDYGAYTRLQTNKTPTISCDDSDVYTLKAGAITADEVTYAGGVIGYMNNSYYLYNDYYYWTMTPSRLSGVAFVFYVTSTGRLDSEGQTNKQSNIRPVINLRSDVEFNSGSDGTQNNPYVVQ